MSLRNIIGKSKNMGLLNTARYYHNSNSGRALMGSTEVQEPPKHYYQYLYQYDIQPDALCGVRYPNYEAHVKAQYFAFENFSFR